MEKKENYYKGKKTAMISVTLDIIDLISIIFGIILDSLVIWR